MNLSIIIPALNEAEALPHVLEELKRVLPRVCPGGRWQLIVADNGSTDQTASRAKEGGADVVVAPRRGYGSACLAAMDAVRTDTDVVVFVDGDHSIHADDLAELVRPIADDQAEFVIGVRAPDTGDALTSPQKIGNALACALVRLFYRHRFHDLGPFRAIRWGALKSLKMRDPAFGWTLEMQIKAVKQGLRISEVPVRWRCRIGESKISGTVTGSVRAGIGILGTVIRYYRV